MPTAAAPDDPTEAVAGAPSDDPTEAVGGSDDPTEVMMVMELADLEQARTFLASPEGGTRAWMDRLGMEIYPTFFVGEQAEAVLYTPPSDASS